MGATEAITVERWTANKWVQGQARLLADNKYDEGEEFLCSPADPGHGPNILNDNEEEMIKLLRPAFHKDMCLGDIKAIL